MRENTSKGKINRINKITYRLYYLIVISLILCLMSACGRTEGSSDIAGTNGSSDITTNNGSPDNDSIEESSDSTRTDGKSDIIRTGPLELSYATQFSVDYYSEGYIHIHIEDGNEYILVPDGKEDNDLGYEGATIIRQPVGNIYLAASSAMDLFLQLGSLDMIKTCSTAAEDYSILEVQDRINSGVISYAGKYSAPDYEMLLNKGCSLAIESTMIYHTPEVKEQLEKLGIPVIVERSSYEEEPLGRLEWIKLYGVLLGKEEVADSYFQEQSKAVEELKEKLAEEDQEQKKTVAFFYVSSNGYINVRKPGDYLSKMIQMAGGNYAFENLKLDEENALSTVNINWEDFYREAKDADILIYNGTVDGGIKSLDELMAKNELFSSFKAVQTGNVWCTNMNMFQETSKVKEVVEDFYSVINETESDPGFLYRVE